jgi:hypothetical protein
MGTARRATIYPDPDLHRALREDHASIPPLQSQRDGARFAGAELGAKGRDQRSAGRRLDRQPWHCGSELTEDGRRGEDRGEHAGEKLEVADPFQGDDARAVGHRRSDQPADSSRSSSAG